MKNLHIVIFFFIFNNSFAQTWNLYTKENTNGGLNTGLTAFIADFKIDNLGNAWFVLPNRGVTKFDGKTWTSFTKENTSENLFSNRTNKLSINENGIISAITASNSKYKTSYFDGKIWMSADKISGVDSLKYFKSQTDKSGKKWVVTSSGIALIEDNKLKYFDNIDAKKIKDLLMKAPDNKGNLTVYGTPLLGSPSIWMPDNKGNIWFAYFSYGKNHITKFDGKTFTEYDKKQTLATSNDFITSMVVDHNNNVWVTYDGGGVSKFDGQTWTNYNRQNTNKGLASDRIRHAFVDKNNNLWVVRNDFMLGTSGLSKFDGKTWTDFSSKNTQGFPESFVINTYYILNNYYHENTPIAEDIEGNIWVATDKGVLKFDNQKWDFYSKEKTPEKIYDYEYNSVVTEKNGNVWLVGFSSLTLIKK